MNSLLNSIASGTVQVWEALAVMAVALVPVGSREAVAQATPCHVTSSLIVTRGVTLAWSRARSRGYEDVGLCCGGIFRPLRAPFVGHISQPVVCPVALEELRRLTVVVAFGVGRRGSRGPGTPRARVGRDPERKVSGQWIDLARGPLGPFVACVTNAAVCSTGTGTGVSLFCAPAAVGRAPPE